MRKQSHQYKLQCIPLWQQRRRVLSHANGHKGAECHPAIDCPKHRAPAAAIWPFSTRLHCRPAWSWMDISTDCCTCWAQRTIAPKLLYCRKICDLTELLTPLPTHTILYSRKWPQSSRKTLKNISFFVSVWQCYYLYKPKDFHCNHFHSFISDNW